MNDQTTSPHILALPKRKHQPDQAPINPAAPLLPILMRLAREERAKMDADERGAA